MFNRINDPFPPFDRPALPKERKLLSELELEFYQDLVGNFWGCDGQVLLHRIPLPPGSPLDTGDQAIWHGVYTAVLALRYHLTQDDQPSNVDTYAHLVQAAKGLKLHQTIHGEPKPRLIRGVSDDQRTFQDDASNDSASGHLLGIYFGWKFGPETMRPVFAELAAGLAAELHNHADNLVGPAGAPTTYGTLVDGWKTDPLRLTLALAIYAVGATVCREATFIQDYERLFRAYKAIIPYPKVKLWWLENQNDTHRAAMHLAILADLTTGEANSCYHKGLLRLQEMALAVGNVWVLALCAFGLGTQDPAIRPLALKVLSEFSLKEKQFNDGRDNFLLMTKGPYPYSPVWFKPVLWNGMWMANQPLPRWQARSQDFFWQRNLRSLDVGSDGGQPDSRLNGGDFLAAYWLSRATGILNEKD